MKANWRIPTIAELTTLVSYSQDVPSFAPNYRNGVYWSISEPPNAIPLIITFTDEIHIERAPSRFHQTNIIFVRRVDNTLNWSKVYVRYSYLAAINRCREINHHHLRIKVEFYTVPALTTMLTEGFK